MEMDPVKPGPVGTVTPRHTGRVKKKKKKKPLRKTRTPGNESACVEIGPIVHTTYEGNSSCEQPNERI